MLKAVKVKDFERIGIPGKVQTDFTAQTLEVGCPDAVQDVTYTANLTTGSTQEIEIVNATGEVSVEQRWVYDTEEREQKFIVLSKLIPYLWDQNQKQQEQLDAQAILIEDLQERVEALEKPKADG